MAGLQITLLTISIVFSSFCISRTSAIAMEASFASISSPSTSPSPSPIPSPSQELQESQFSPTSLMEPILRSLGFEELAMAAQSLSLSNSIYTSWDGPSTLFAPTDEAIRSCSVSCSISRILREHIVPGLFSIDYLSKFDFGTKIETIIPGRCITITSAIANNNNNTTKIIFVGGVEITHPELFNNGLIVIHRIEGLISPLSCDVEKMNSPLSFFPHTPPLSQTIMRLMLRDAILRLRNNGYSILSLALRVKYAELVNVQNMTVFTLDDKSIFSGGQAYVNNVRFHIVPNRLLMHTDLMRLPAGTRFDTLERGQTLVVTTAAAIAPIRINYVGIKIPDVMHNLKIVVHSVFLPFPHIHPAALIGGSTWDALRYGGTNDAEDDGGKNVAGGNEYCTASEEGGGCDVAEPTSYNVAPTEMNHNGL